VYRQMAYLPLCLLLAPEPHAAPPAAETIAAFSVLQEPLPTGDVIAFLDKCRQRYDQQQIKGYSVILHKQERIGGKLYPPEEIQCFYREKPYSVFMHWLRGQRKAESSLYVEGENGGKMLAKPAGLAGLLVAVVERDVDGADARQSGRYTMKEFGLKSAIQKTCRDWKAAKEKGTLRAQYLGVHKVHEAGDRLCYTVRRTCAVPEEDGVMEVTIYIDKENWLQVGSVLKGNDGRLIGEYMFRDLRINPQFKSDQFQRAALTRKD
jgi:Protein of unknown function (DUF1571)